MMLAVTKYINFASVIVVSSVMFGTRLEPSPARRDLSGPAYTEVEQALRPHGTFMLPAIVIAVVSTAALLALVWRRGGLVRWLTLLALACMITLTVVTATVHLPINNDIERWSVQDPPSDWRAKRDRWEDWHDLRALAAVLGLGCLIGAAVKDQPRRTE